MEIYRINETYSNVGRINREPTPDFELNKNNPDPTQVKDGLESPEGQTADIRNKLKRAKTRLARQAALNLGQAKSLTALLSDTIKTGAENPWQIDYHDLTQARLIAPRYV